MAHGLGVRSSRQQHKGVTVMWRAVVLQAVRDVLIDLDDVPYQQQGLLAKAHMDAVSFFRGGPDFEQVCALAEIEPSSFLETYRSGRMAQYAAQLDLRPARH